MTQRRSQKKTRTTFEHQQLRMSNIDWLIRLVIRKWQGIMFVKICWHRSLKHVTKGSAQNLNYIECRGTYHAQSSFNYSYSRLYKFLVATHITNGQKFQTISTIALFMFFNFHWYWRQIDFCVFCSNLPQKISQKNFIFNTSIRVPNIIFDALICFYM